MDERLMQKDESIIIHSVLDHRNGKSGSGTDSAMTREPLGQADTLKRIRAIFVESLELNLGEDESRSVTRLSDIAGVDSMAVVLLVAAVEKEFHIEIELERLELDFLEDLPRLAAYVDARVAPE